MNTQDKPKRSEHSTDDDREFEKLEEMWDRQIMKGDDEFFESRVPSKSIKGKKDLSEKTEPVKERKRRGRKM
jgi:hypothetical protein